MTTSAPGPMAAIRAEVQADRDAVYEVAIGHSEMSGHDEQEHRAFGETAALDRVLALLDAATADAPAAPHPVLSFVNAVNGDGGYRCYPDTASAWEAAVTERPYNNTRTSAGWCDGSACTLAGEKTGDDR